MIRCFSVFLFLLIAVDCFAQNNFLNDVPAAFNNIPAQPRLTKFSCKGFKIPRGGHLQGIQSLSEGNDETLVLTASSITHSYCVIVKNSKVVTLQKLMDAPFRHAGGCQITDGKVAVGIEDNISKDKSKVVVFNL